MFVLLKTTETKQIDDKINIQIVYLINCISGEGLYTLTTLQFIFIIMPFAHL